MSEEARVEASGAAEGDVEGDCGFAVEVGVLDACQPDFRVWMGGKVGGRPVWLRPDAPLAASEATCDSCGDPLVFLCQAGLRLLPSRMQLYNPLESPESFHRVIYVFVCGRPGCLLRQNVSAFRCCLPQVNAWYPTDPDPDAPPPPPPSESPEGVAAPPAACCSVCGLASRGRCSRCHRAEYCSRRHQELDWRGGHSSGCARTSTSFGFPEFEIRVEDEPFDAEERAREDAVLEAKVADAEASGEAGDIDEKDVASAMRQAGLRPPEVSGSAMVFQHRVRLVPEQVVRLFCHDDRAVLWSTAQRPASVPPCLLCHSPRSFEIQVMPQLIALMGLDSVSPETIDFSSIVVYTCASDCHREGSVFYREFAFVEDPNAP